MGYLLEFTAFMGSPKSISLDEYIHNAEAEDRIADVIDVDDEQDYLCAEITASERSIKLVKLTKVREVFPGEA